MHELGFDVIAKKKETFVDGHERDDVVEYCSKFLRKMVGLGFFNSRNYPSEDEKSALSKFNIQPPQHFIDKIVIIFHDDSTLHTTGMSAAKMKEVSRLYVNREEYGTAVTPVSQNAVDGWRH